MGLARAPGAFQNLKELILSGLLYKIVLLYLEDIVILGRTLEEHLDRLEHFLCRLEEAGLKNKMNRNIGSFQGNFIFVDILCRTTA